MKKNYINIKTLLTSVTAILSVIGCSPNIKDAIPGVYTTQWTTEFTEARDTILITLSSGLNNIYCITRLTYMLVQQKPQYKISRWTGIFNAENNCILINNNGRMLSFDPLKREMNMGTTTYKKL